MATFSVEINIAPSLCACVMAWFQEGDVSIWVLARGWADVLCDLAMAVPRLELAGRCAPPGAQFRVSATLSAAPHSPVGHTLGWGTNPWKQRKVLSVSRGLCVADPACSLPREAEAGMCW